MLQSELEFRGEEWATLDGALVPSPACIAAEAALVREGRTDSLDRTLDDPLDFGAALIRQAVSDIEQYRVEGEPRLFLRAQQALAWIVASCDYTPGLTFTDACQWAGAEDSEVVRQQVLHSLGISLDQVEALAA